MVRYCPSCDGQMLHKYIAGGDGIIFLKDHVPLLLWGVGGERIHTPLSTYHCKRCGIILIDQHDTPVKYQVKMKCPYCQKVHIYSDKDVNRDSTVISKSCLKQFFLEVH